MSQRSGQQSAQRQPPQLAETPKMYRELASWWHLLSPPSEYAEEAAFFHKVLHEAVAPPPRTLLELGSGGGNNASHLKAYYAMTLVDLSEGMLAASRALNPECEHIAGDMRTARLGRVFDAVFIHDAIMYMTTADDLRRALETAYVHCRAGGVALFVPDHVRETFRPATEHGGADGAGRALRYLEWTHEPRANDTTYEVDFVYVLREGAEVRVEHDRHMDGLFPRTEWLRLLRVVGFEPTVVVDSYGRDLFVGIKPPR